MKPVYILKIGGSVATYKNRPGFSVRRSLLRKVAIAIKSARDKKDFELILIHGAGALGHTLAKQYDLAAGVGKDEKKLRGAILSRSANQKLDNAIAEIFAAEGLSVTPVHTASVIKQNRQQITDFEMDFITEALKQNCIPMLYGDMVFDSALGMSICSGDAIAPYIAKKMKVQKIFFASDVDGIFTKDPYVFKDAILVEEIRLAEIFKKIQLSKSHNVDVTDGLLGKIQKFKNLQDTSVATVEIFDGFDEKKYEGALLGEKFKHTVVYI